MAPRQNESVMGLSKLEESLILSSGSRLLHPSSQLQSSLMLRMSVKLRDDAPVLAHTLSKLLWQKGFRGYLLNVREQFDPERLDAGVLFAAAVMATTIDVERGVKGLSEAEAAVCYGDLTVLLTRIKDPYLAYCVIEFQRVLAEHFPVIRYLEE